MSNVSRGCCLSDRCGGWCRTLLCHSVRIALPDEVFVGLNTLVGLAYLSGYERIVVPMAAMIFCVAVIDIRVTPYCLECIQMNPLVRYNLLQ